MLDHVRADHDRSVELLGGQRERAGRVEVVLAPAECWEPASSQFHVRAIVEAEDVEALGEGHELAARAGAEIDDPGGAERGCDVGGACIHVALADDPVAVLDEVDEALRGRA